MREAKCVSCGYLKDSRTFLIGLCKFCQDYILKERNNEHDKWCSDESIRLERSNEELKEERVRLKDAKKGLELIGLLKEVLRWKH